MGTSRLGAELPRNRRLTGINNYQTLFQNAKRFRARHLTILVTPKDNTYARIGFAISKKNVPTAVSRNRIKRLVKESFRQEPFFQQLGLDMVVMTRREILQDNNEQIRYTCEQLWEQIKICYNASF